jgi:2-dehydro-3-deoxyphosphogluconate aldolase/(4S)-4-hydroxy-2-oxoglutarate aldolase
MKDAFLAQLRTDRVIGLTGALPADALVDCARALSAGGVHCLELAMTTPAVLEALEKASAELPDFHFGLGTVLDVDTARLGLLAGAHFIVTPAPRADVITLCRRFNAAVISSAFSLPDVVAAQRDGADGVKLFPGELFGPAHLRAIQPQAPDIPLIPIGGVTPSTVAEFLRAGALATFAGSSLLDEAELRQRQWPQVTARAAAFHRAIAVLDPAA